MLRVLAPKVATASTKTGAPFFATARETFDQKLPDGSFVRGFARIHQARNLVGATRSEGPLRCFRDADGSFKLALSVTTYVPLCLPCPRDTLGRTSNPCEGRFARRRPR